jgi:hypothetical protein
MDPGIHPLSWIFCSLHTDIIHNMSLLQLIERLKGIAGEVGAVSVTLATIVIFLVLRTFFFRFRRFLRYSHIPGPPTTGWSALWLLYKSLGGEAHKVFWETNEKYGMSPHALCARSPHGLIIYRAYRQDRAVPCYYQ